MVGSAEVRVVRRVRAECNKSGSSSLSRAGGSTRKPLERTLII